MPRGSLGFGSPGGDVVPCICVCGTDALNSILCAANDACGKGVVTGGGA